MNWLTKGVRRGLGALFTDGDNNTPDNLWFKCPDTSELISRHLLEENSWVFPSGSHMRISAHERLNSFFRE